MTVRLLLVVVLTVAAARWVHATCPQSVDDCLGQAAAFDLVAEKLLAGVGTLVEPGEGISRSGAAVGDACAPTAIVGGCNAYPTMFDNLILTAASGGAVRFLSFRCDGQIANPAVYINFDLSTGGGVVLGEAAVQVNGMTDTSGAAPRVGTCAQALADMHSAAANLATLTPTRDLGSVRPDPNGSGSVQLTADPGVNVWTASDLTARTRKDFPGVDTTSIIIALDPATDSVIINVGKVNVMKYSEITVYGGDETKVLLNVASSVRNKGSIRPRILSPDGSVTMRGLNDAKAIAARKVTVFGGDVF